MRNYYLTSKSSNTGLRSAALIQSCLSNSVGRVTGQRFESQVRQNIFNLFKWGIEPKGEQQQEQEQQQQ